MSTSRPVRWSFWLVLLALVVVPLVGTAYQAAQPPAAGGRGGASQVATQADRQKMMDLLGIKSLRPGLNGSNPQAPNYANYDESKANPYPKLPDPMVLKNGKPVTSAKRWWNQRRPEIVEDFDREIYGRVPKVVPKVKWEVVSVTKDKNGEIPIITKQIVGHVDNSSYPQVTVDIQVTLSTPANATGKVPVIMQFGGFGGGAARAGARGAGPVAGAPSRAGAPPAVAGRGPSGPSCQQQVLAKGWG